MMMEPTPSLVPKDLSSTTSLYNLSAGNANSDDLSARGVFEMDMAELDESRPISRCSINSGVSITARKDGIEGSRIKRTGIPQYSLNLLNTMAHNQYKKLQESYTGTPPLSMNTEQSHSSINSRSQSQSQSQISYPDFPHYPPMSLREKMKLLNNDHTNLMKMSHSSESLYDSLMYESNCPSSTSVTELFPQSTNIVSNSSSTKEDNVPTVHSLEDDYNNLNCNRLTSELHIDHLSIEPRSNNNTGINDIDSNASTMGDDISYLNAMRTLHTPAPFVDSQQE